MSRFYDFSLSHNPATGFIEKRLADRRETDRFLYKNPQAISSILRYLLYAGVSAVLIQGIILATGKINASSFFSENGFVELLQFSLLLSCSGLLQLAAKRSMPLREAFHFISILPLAAAAREMDKTLDVHVFDGTWQLVVFSLMLYLAFFTWRNYQALQKQMVHLVSSFPIGWLFSGFLLVMVFSRLIGQQVFWQMALQENYLRFVGRVVEESCELFGYLIIFFGCLEFLLAATLPRRSAAAENPGKGRP
ncbi:MAG TPA: hypothetical protein VIU33_09815 [Nitrospiria bacterium]